MIREGSSGQIDGNIFKDVWCCMKVEMEKLMETYLK